RADPARGDRAARKAHDPKRARPRWRKPLRGGATARHRPAAALCEDGGARHWRPGRCSRHVGRLSRWAEEITRSRGVPGREMETLVELIAHKRDGGRLTAEQIERLIRALQSGELADYQMSALLMAIYFRGMDDAETVALTRAMLHSG